MIVTVRDAPQWRRTALLQKATLYFAAFVKSTAAFAGTSSLSTVSPDVTAIATMLYRTMIAILTVSRSPRALGRPPDCLRVGLPLTAGATPPAGFGGA
jgi:hypothetical protein